MTRARILPQPEYRALVMFDRLPEGCISFLCTDVSSMPHVRPGESVVVDTTDREPSAGELFVIKFGEYRSNYHICLASRRPSRCLNAELGAMDWWVGAARNVEVRVVLDRIFALDIPHEEKNARAISAHVAAGGWTEGPYREGEGSISFQHLRNCLVGRVIGIYAPKFEEPKRVVAS